MKGRDNVTGMIFENAYHEEMLKSLKREEEKQWEFMRHEKEVKNILEREEEREK